MNHYKRIGVILTVLLVPALLSGCAEVKEINDMAIVSGFSIDVTPEGLYQVTAEVVNKSTEGSPEEAREVIAAQGYTLGDALENCNFEDSRQIYFSHAKTLILSRQMAEQEGIEEILDYVMRNYKTRLSMDLIISDLPNAASAVELTTSSTGLLFFDLEEMIRTDRLYGACTPMKVYQAVNTLSQDGTEMTIPLLQSENGKASLSGTAVFSKNKMIDVITHEETLYLLMLQDHLASAHLTLPEYGMTFQIAGSELSFRHSEEGGRTSLSAVLKLTCTVSQAASRLKAHDTAFLSAELERSVEEKCTSLIEKAQRWNADIFGFGKSMGDAEYRFSDLPIAVNCTVNLKIGEVH